MARLVDLQQVNLLSEFHLGASSCPNCSIMIQLSVNVLGKAVKDGQCLGPCINVGDLENSSWLCASPTLAKEPLED